MKVTTKEIATGDSSLSDNKVITLSVLLMSIIPVFLFINRFLIPDWSFDVINYHLINGSKGVTGFFRGFDINSEFYPLGLYSFNNLYGTISNYIINILGYRLGTIISLLAIVGSNYYLVKIALNLNKNFFKKPLLAISLLLLVSVNLESYFEIATYYQDNINTLFHIASVFYLLKSFNGEEVNFKYQIVSATIIGISLFSKNTSIIFAIPITIVFIFKYLVTSKPKIAKLAILTLIIYLPFFIQSLDKYLLTGNPTFPFYNNIFKSVYYMEKSYTFPFGPSNLKDYILWPIYAFTQPERYGEIQGLYNDGKITIYMFSLVILFARNIIKKEKISIKELVLISSLVQSYLIWLVLFGYSRYGISLELLMGILVVSKIINTRNVKDKLFLLTIIITLLTISHKILIFNLDYDYGARPTLYSNPPLYKSQYRYLKLKKNISNESLVDKANNADIILNFYNGPDSRNGFYTTVLTKPKPMLFVEDSAKRFGFTQKYIDKTNETLKEYFGKESVSFFAICFQHDKNKDFTECENEITKSNKYAIKEYEDVSNFVGYSYPGKDYIFRYYIGKYKIN